ncbi:MAG: carboxylating nicotinate-nucleotide diphosphorylase [Bacillota bacterium]|nr:carboxylating nicotinate-nucleotide diphosphorylase [Bacillota bacterium]
MKMKFDRIEEIISAALSEDTQGMDLTSESIFEPDYRSTFVLIAKEDGVIGGLQVFESVFKAMDPVAELTFMFGDGDRVKNGDQVAKISGLTSRLLMAERTALNILQRMSGIATATRLYVEAVAPYKAKIVDTRKTVPGLRILDKKAVVIGGGYNHRMGLYDAVLIKDNHIDAVSGISEAVKRCKSKVSHMVKIEVEIRSVSELEEAIAAGADVVLLDNMSNEDMAEAVRISDGRVLLEASGNMSLERVHDVAKTGVDLISVGALTHSVRALDLSMRAL